MNHYASARAESYREMESFEEQSEELGPLDIPTNWEEQEPWMAILIDELGRSFREFARESSRLTRLVQPKRKCRIPSEGFNLQLSTRMEKVDIAFHTYMRRKQELLSYILATASQAQKRNAHSLNPPHIMMDSSIAADIR